MKERQLQNFAKRLGSSLSSHQIIQGFSIDSRKIKEGEIFFALKGAKVDGHDFLKEVAAKKALAAVVSKHFHGSAEGLPLILVDDVLETMRELAREEFARHGKKIAIAVTGSVGKTTTKEFIAALLAKRFKVGKTPGSCNSQATLPLSILNFEGDEEVLVLEMGMSRHKEIERLVQIAPPDIALINKIALAHAAFFPGGKEEIARAKSEILSQPQTKLAIMHQQTAQFKAIKEIPCNKLCFSLEPGADYSLFQKEGKWTVVEKGIPSPLFTLPFQESHLCENFVGAVVVARSLGMSWEEIYTGAAELKPFSKRFEKVEKGNVLFINDSYNANPESMQAALSNLPLPKKGRKTIAVLGEMRELGVFSKQCHQEIGKYALKAADEVLCFGKECLPIFELFKEVGRPAEITEDFAELYKCLYQKIQPGDVVLIKGSNSLQLWRLLDEESK